MENPCLKDISWQVDEPTYRADKALSYSTLAKYEREGFNNLSKLFDKVESPSLTFGSCVDSLITGGEEEFNNNFFVAELTNISDVEITITKKLYNKFSSSYNDINDIPDNYLLDTIQDIQWNNHWLPKTRVKKIKEDCKGYYQLLYIANDRSIINTSLYRDVMNTVEALKTSNATRFYFEEDNIFNKNIERFYQLKFKSTFNNINYRCMADEIIVIHDKKLIIPIDLKTSSKCEWDFYKSFIEWRYDIQSRLYFRIIKDNLERSSLFKNYILTDYKFIVCNRKTLTPLVWNCSFTQSVGDIKLGKDNQIILRDPFNIGEELNNYLINNPKVPNKINIDKPNDLKYWINKL